MRAKSLVPYFGGKRQLAGEIVAELGPHRHYWEPLCGGLSVLLAKPPSVEETVNDVNDHVTNLAMVIASDRWEELRGRLRRTLMCEALFHAAKRRFKAEAARPAPADPAAVTDADVDRAYWFFLVSWLGMQGVAGTRRANYQFAMRYTCTPGGGGARFMSAVESVEAWHGRLRRVLILNRDAFALLARISDEPGVVIYADPPYFIQTRGVGGGSRYEHDFTLRDHVRLARLARRFRHARVVVSYYDHPYLERLYVRRGWTKRVLPRRENAGRGVEVLLINGPSLAAEPEPALWEAHAEGGPS